MSQDEFKKLFKYIQEFREEVKAENVELLNSINQLTNTIDRFIKRLDDIETDNTARDAQIARIERWIEQIAQKTGVKLEY
jgi:predicted nuclease with TOPRIM domain